MVQLGPVRLDSHPSILLINYLDKRNFSRRKLKSDFGGLKVDRNYSYSKALCSTWAVSFWNHLEIPGV